MITSQARAKYAVAAHDVLAVPVSIAAGAVLAGAPLADVQGLAAAAVIAAFPAVYLSGIHGQVWRFTSFQDLVTVLLAALFTAVSAVGLTALAGGLNQQLIQVAGAGLAILLVLWMAPRLLVRSLRDLAPAPAGRDEHGGELTLLAGDGRRARAFLRANEERPQLRIVGVLSDDPKLHHRSLLGAPVLGGLADLSRIMAHQQLRGTRPTRLVLAADEVTRTDLERALGQAAEHGLTLSRLPETEGRGAPRTAVKPVVLDDLLGRKPAVLDADAMADLLHRKVVMITGAGGSIGSELVHQVAALDPSLIVLVENSEFNLYRIDLECARAHPNVKRVAALCDVRDRAALQRWFASHRPDLVFHAAAYKHVPLLEEHPEEGVLTNVLGTQHVAELSREHGVQAMVFVSTDKAVHPTSIMGATKRCAEILCQGYDGQRRTGSTRHLCVRFGNVLGSAGSVVPLFAEQIAQGGPLTVTHPEMTRFFMTIPEAVQLILQATVTAVRSPGEPGGVHVLDMGEPLKILNLAERVIQLSGRRPYVDVPIQIVGLRPGEKLHEELAYAEEYLGPSDHPGVFLARPPAAPLPAALGVAERMIRAAREGQREAVVRAIAELVPEFAPTTADYRRILERAAPVDAPARQGVRVLR